MKIGTADSATKTKSHIKMMYFTEVLSPTYNFLSLLGNFDKLGPATWDKGNCLYFDGNTPTIDDHKRFAETVFSEGYDGVSIGSRLQNNCPSYSLDFLKYYKGIRCFILGESKVMSYTGLELISESLEYIGINMKQQQSDISDLLKCKNLKVLSVSNGQIGLGAISNLHNLKELSLHSCNLSDIDFSQLKQLKTLSLTDNCKNVEKSNIGELRSIEGLSISNTNNLSNFDFLSTMINLKVASFFWVTKFESIPDISNLAQLKGLAFETCGRLNDISAVANNHSIERLLILQGIKNADFALPLVKHPSLKHACLVMQSAKQNTRLASMLGDIFNCVEIYQNPIVITV